jgi:peptidoglycan/LPS O-acetylase OafA/YrhL
MKSSTGQHWIALDHIRAFAAFSVFTWHFVHGATGYPVSFSGAPAIFPFAILDEGHTGVALFMALSGYLFAKLLDGKAVAYGPFFWNRLLRLAPLLLLVIVIKDVGDALHGNFRPLYWLQQLAAGLVLPSWPNGGWSITVEAHFYLVLPLLMWATRRNRFAPLGVLVAAIALRCALFAWRHQVEDLAYWTIIGHIDQFLLGIFAFNQRAWMQRNHVVAAAVALGLAGLWYAFDVAGGFNATAQSPLWIVLPTFEAVAYSALIAYYDTSYTPKTTGISGLIGKAGAYSYSIYLLHVFIVFRAAAFIDRHIMSLSNFYVACAWSAVLFMLMIPVGHLSFKYIEEPFLKLRRRYIRLSPAEPSAEPRVRTV